MIPEKNSQFYEKKLFTMITNDVDEYLVKHKDRDNIILCGIETHVCIQQTTLDLLDRNYNVFLLADGTSSQNVHDRSVGIERLRDAGAIITTTESVLFDLLKDSTHPKFKEMLKLFKTPRPCSQLPLI